MAATNAAYDDIAEQYKDSKKMDFREFVEHHTLHQVLAKTHPDLGPALPQPWLPIKEPAILDLACGEGIYSRAMKRVGAREVLGVDISREMVALAEKAEAAEPLGCQFVVGDASKLDLGVEHEGRYDIVLAMWLLNYAEDSEQLEGMVASAFKCLKPGGRLIGINDWPGNPLESYQLYQPYGFVKVAGDAPRQPASTFEWRITLPDQVHRPTPYTLNPKPRALSPQLLALSPKPQALNPEP
jgi:SAM-dependent methyltransferase